MPDDVLAWSSEAFAEIGAATGPPATSMCSSSPGRITSGDWAPRPPPTSSRCTSCSSSATSRPTRCSTPSSPPRRRWPRSTHGRRGWPTRPIRATGVRPLAEQPLGDVVAKRIRKAHRRIIDDGRQIGATSPAESLHDLRKQAKKLRYLLECFASLLPAAERKQFVRALKVLQDNLGEHQDAAVHADELRAVGEEVHAAGVPAGTMFALGELRAQVDAQRAVARAEFAERFAEFDTAATRQALRAMLAGLPTLEDSPS